MHLIALFLACVATNSTSALAAESCSVTQAISQVRVDIAERQARSATVLQPMLEEISALGAKAKDLDRPLVDQMAPRDAVRFSEIRAQTMPIRVAELLESAQFRDATAVATMISDAWRMYESPTDFPKAGNVPGEVLLLMRAMFPKAQSAPSPAQLASCTVDLALAGQERAALRRIDSSRSLRDMPIVNQLKAKYQGSLDPSTMDAEDVQTMQRVIPEMQPAFREQQLAGDLDNIRGWWSVAELVYQIRREDLETYGANAASIGRTLQARALDPRTQAMVGLWITIDERMLSDEARNLRQMQPIVDALKRSGQQ